MNTPVREILSPNYDKHLQQVVRRVVNMLVVGLRATPLPSPVRLFHPILDRMEEIPLETRLESVAIDPAFDMWMRASRGNQPGYPMPGFSAPRILKVHEGYAFLQVGLSLLGPKAWSMCWPIDPRDEDPEIPLAAILTDPRVPDILGDELAHFFNGLAALMVAGETGWGVDLVGVFVDKMKRVPRLVVLSFLAAGHERLLRDEWESLVTTEDIGILWDDVLASYTHSSALAKIVGSEV